MKEFQKDKNFLSFREAIPPKVKLFKDGELNEKISNINNEQIFREHKKYRHNIKKEQAKKNEINNKFIKQNLEENIFIVKNEKNNEINIFFLIYIIINIYYLK